MNRGDAAMGLASSGTAHSTTRKVVPMAKHNSKRTRILFEVEHTGESGGWRRSTPVVLAVVGIGLALLGIGVTVLVSYLL